jgi:CheY-like chemotaxis protein
VTDDSSHILLIEDNPGDVQLIEECLRVREIPYNLTHCDTVESAVRLVKSYGAGDRVPDLMLLDYNLPRGEARTVLQASSTNPALAQMRKVVVTSSLAPKDRQEALEFGADAFIYKPADLDCFLTDVGGRIAALLGRS